MICGQCGTDNDAGRKFCTECGASLAAVCPACGVLLTGTEKFCGECGTPLGAEAAVSPSPRAEPAAERKLVSVLFADLVGFTTLTEQRDSEDTRALLSRYFETCQRLISIYGGTVEKFIGDAVMAVWGAPTANEDDAERAVRAALDLVAAVPELDQSLAARAGVLTGEAAVTFGAADQGMVAGDLVNTASRIQSTAEPGTVLVGEATKRASEAAIAYQEGRLHELKGKAEPVQLFRALRVTAARGGALKSEGLEPPFVGRDRELRLVKELFHASADERKAHLVTISGIAGIGKSRLAWEFFKYIDGLAETVWWHHGRCLAYGEGVAYWALAEMVRMRAGIVEGEEPESARAKLRAALTEHVSDPEERSWIEPRLAHVLGLEERQASEREDLFAAWRLLFERMAERQPLVMVFEDMQWADVALLDFVDYVFEWSRNHPIFVLTLARPELAERHTDFGKSSRNTTTLSLEPLSAEAMEALLDGFVPGLPEALRRQILERSEGVPLYAVETVRMLLDRGLLAREGEVYAPTGPIEALDVPETLHALVAARLDGLSPEERGLVQDASVLGKTFTKASLSDLSGLREQDLDPLLASLVRKEVLSVQADPRSPERGQFGFLQDLLKRVAYETLSKRERKARHLAAADYLGRSWGPAEHEIVEVVASHYLAAYETAPEAEDAAEIKAKAREQLARAGERAASLAGADEAQRYFEQAAGLAEEPLTQARLLERAGEMALARAIAEQAQAHFERAIALFESEGERHSAARVSSRLGEAEVMSGRLDDAVARMERAFQVLSHDEPDEALATLAAQLARAHFLRGELESSGKRIETALEIAESLWLPEVLSHALNTKGVIANFRSRPEEALALMQRALVLALEHELPSAAFRAYQNLADVLGRRDRYADAIEHLRSGLTFARRVGNRFWEWELLSELTCPLWETGRWDEALECAAEIPEEQVVESALGSVIMSAPAVEIARGRRDEARRLLSLVEDLEVSADVQGRASYLAAKAELLHAEGSDADALAAAREALASRAVLGATNTAWKLGFVHGVEAADALGDLEAVEELVAMVDALPPGQRPGYLRGHAARFRARLSSRREGADPDGGYRLAEAIFREFGLPFWLAVTQLEHGEWLEQGRSDEAEPLLAEAREIFEQLGATPWLERAGGVRAAEEVGV